MPGMRVRQVGDKPIVRRETYPLGNSLTYRDGDLVVNTTGVVSTGALRLLATADATALYETAANDAVGVLGVFCDAVTTDANGVATSRPDPITRAAGVGATHILGSVAASIPATTGGRSNAIVQVIEPETQIGGVLLETTTIVDTLIGTRVGLSMVVTSGVTAFVWSTAATTKIGTIVGVNRQDPKYNLSGGGGEVYVKIDPGYCQYENGINYAT